MMLTIAILSAIGCISSIVTNAINGKLEVNVLFATILVLSSWSCLPIAIIVIVITFLIGLIGSVLNEDLL